MDYRASKAWHFSHQLALGVRELVSEVVSDDEVAIEMARRLKQASTHATNTLARSVDKQSQSEKLAHYKASRTALEDVNWHLHLAERLNYIDTTLRADLTKLAQVAYNELSSLIQSMEPTQPQE